jgi:hypothetical protein
MAFVRKVDGTDRTVTNHFCPDCGGTVYWTLDLRPKHIGIAAGSFTDPAFAAPSRAVWTQHKHEWVPCRPTFRPIRKPCANADLAMSTRSPRSSMAASRRLAR